MTDRARRDVGELLAAQLEAIEGDMLARQAPFAEAREMRRQRDEYRRRVLIAEGFVADQPCTCKTPDDQCPKHYLEGVLAGDE